LIRAGQSYHIGYDRLNRLTDLRWGGTHMEHFDQDATIDCIARQALGGWCGKTRPDPSGVWQNKT
jgi:hypothetical protein